MKILNKNYKKKEEFVSQIEVEDNFRFLFSILFTLNYISGHTCIRQCQIGHLGQPKLDNLNKIGIFPQLVESARCKVCLGIKCRCLWLDTVSLKFNVCQCILWSRNQ